MAPNPTSDWTELHDRFYRKQEIYSLSWNQTDLSKFMISGAQYGGPIGKQKRKRERHHVYFLFPTLSLFFL
ncbi:hypothetical protein BD770DRAFT_14112 [Pilaira anomala]|nr:hypothetical protein BD770DRAFT_14112 [Pilaira anomala]